MTRPRFAFISNTAPRIFFLDRNLETVSIPFSIASNPNSFSVGGAGRKIAFAMSASPFIRVFDIETGEMDSDIASIIGAACQFCKISPDEKYLYVCHNSFQSRFSTVIDLISKQRVTSFASSATSNVSKAAFSYDYLIEARAVGAVRLYSLPDFSVIANANLLGTFGSSGQIDIALAGSFAAARSSDVQQNVFYLPSLSVASFPNGLIGSNLKFNPAASSLAAASGNLRIADTSSGAVNEISLAESAFYVQWQESGEKIYLASYFDPTIKILNAQSFEEEGRKNISVSITGFEIIFDSSGDNSPRNPLFRHEPGKPLSMWNRRGR